MPRRTQAELEQLVVHAGFRTLEQRIGFRVALDFLRMLGLIVVMQAVFTVIAGRRCTAAGPDG